MIYPLQLFLSLLQEAVDLANQDDPTTAAGEFATVVQAMTALVEKKPLAGLFANLPGCVIFLRVNSRVYGDPMFRRSLIASSFCPRTTGRWIPDECTGKSLEKESPLGKIFSFKVMITAGRALSVYSQMSYSSPNLRHHFFTNCFRDGAKHFRF